MVIINNQKLPKQNGWSKPKQNEKKMVEETHAWNKDPKYLIYTYTLVSNVF